MMKDNGSQVRLETEERVEGYIQNEEQDKTGIWKNIRSKDE